MRTIESIFAIAAVIGGLCFVIALPIAFVTGRAGWWRTTKYSLGVALVAAALQVVLNIFLNG